MARWLAAAVLIGACAPVSSEPEETSTSGGETTAATTTTTTTETTSTAEEPPPAIAFGNDAVRARLAALPPSPVALDLRVLDLAPAQAVNLCAYLDALAASAPSSSSAPTECPDGSPVVVGGTCNPANLASAIETLGPSCSIHLGEYVACELAVRADPCSVGFMRAERPECEAVNACLLAASGGT